MTDTWGRINLGDVDDVAPQHGLEAIGEARYVREQVGATTTGLSHYRMNPGRRTGFGHRHDDVEEIYVVVAGTGRVKLDDEIVDLAERDVVRVAPPVVREFEAGPGGMELLATGAHRTGDGAVISGFWPDGA